MYPPTRSRSAAPNVAGAKWIEMPKNGIFAAWPTVARAPRSKRARRDNPHPAPVALACASCRLTLPGAAAAALTCDARDVVGFETRGPVRAVRLGRESAIEARAVLVATGVSYRLLGAPGLGEFTGRGVFYGATASDAQSCAGDDVHVVGAANSAGQAVLNMARFARRVVLLVRSAALENSMSQYLVERIRDAGNIEVRLQAEVVAGRGDDHLQAVTVADRAAGAKEEQPTNWLFIFIGASPRTDWLGPDVARDENGFVITGQDLLTRKDGPHWSLTRPPFVLEMPLIEASPGELNQVWTNIIDNAVDAMDAHGTLRISTRATPRMSSSRSATPALGCHPTYRPERSRRSTPPRTSVKAPGSALISHAASSSSAITARSQSTRGPARPYCVSTCHAVAPNITDAV